jgi:phosphoserine phosphatase
MKRILTLSAAMVLGCYPVTTPPTITRPLASWQDGGARDSIVAFVRAVTSPGSPNFVQPAERIAVFDNDGTLWAEQPVYVQFAFVLDRVRALAPEHSEWRTRQPFKGVLDGDLQGAMAGGTQAVVELVAATHTGLTTAEFARTVSAWIDTARHAQSGKRYTEMVYQPMLELLDYLRANGFKIYIVSGGGIEFMRPWVERVYGIPPDQVIGSSVKLEFEMRDGSPQLLRRPEIDFVDDKEGKPIGIHKFIGRRPIAAFGNSDGDLQMFQWTMADTGRRLAAIVHHTDAEREWAYDRGSHVGRLDQALDEARDKGWLVIDMKTDWTQIYP